MEYQRFSMGQMETNGFILYSGNEAAAVDPGGDTREMQNFLKSNGLRLTLILNTHLHFDHTFGNRDLSDAYAATIRASKMDSFMLEDQSGRGGMWGIPQLRPYEFENLEPGELEILGSPMRVLAVPGHCPGGLAFYFPQEKVVFAGDALFAGAIGRTDFPRGDLQTLMKSIFTQLYTLPEDTVIWPGHGPSTTVGQEKQDNPYNSLYQPE